MVHRVKKLGKINYFKIKNFLNVNRINDICSNYSLSRCKMRTQEAIKECFNVSRLYVVHRVKKSNEIIIRKINFFNVNRINGICPNNSLSRCKMRTQEAIKEFFNVSSLYVVHRVKKSDGINYFKKKSKSLECEPNKWCL